MLDSPELIEPFLIGVSLELVYRDLAITNSGIGKLFFPLPFYRRPHWSTEGALFSLKFKEKFVKTQGVKSIRILFLKTEEERTTNCSFLFRFIVVPTEGALFSLKFEKKS